MIARASGEYWDIPDDLEDFYEYLEEHDAPTNEVREVVNGRFDCTSGDVFVVQAGELKIELEVE